MNGLDIILYLAGMGAIFLLYVVAYSAGHRDGKREGYSRGRSITRITTTNTGYNAHGHAAAVLDQIIKDEIKKQAGVK